MVEDNELAQQQELAKQVHALENLVKTFLSKESISRYSNLKMAHPEKALHILTVLAQLIQKGKIKERLSDQEFKTILLQLTEPKKQTKIVY